MSDGQSRIGVTKQIPAIGFVLMSLLPGVFPTAGQAQNAAPENSNTPAATDVQKSIEQSNRNIDKHIETLEKLADDARRLARGEILEGDEHKHTIIRQAQSFSVKNQAVGIVVAKGKKDEEGLTGERIAEIITTYFTKRGISTKAFVKLSEGDYTAIAYCVKGQLAVRMDLVKPLPERVSLSRSFHRFMALRR